MQDGRSLLVENLARGRGTDASRAALKQRDAQPLLQLCDLLAQGRLRDVDDRSRPGKASGLEDLHEIAELTKLHVTRTNPAGTSSTIACVSQDRGPVLLAASTRGSA